MYASAAYEPGRGPREARDTYTRPAYGGAARDSYPRDSYPQGDRERERGREQYARDPAPTWQPNKPNNTLNDLDMELEVMKKKRLMIQEQRQLLEEQQQLDRLKNAEKSPWENARMYDSERSQPRGQPPPLADFGYLYNSRPQPQSARGTQRGIKRGPGNVQPWQNAPEPKRFAAPTPRDKPSFRPQNNAPRKGPAQGGPSPRVRKEPVLHGVDREVGPVVPPKLIEMPIFRGPDSVSRSVNGRFELALGTITKDLRAEFAVPPHNVVFSIPIMRMLKKTLRERFYKIFMNKPVPSAQDLIAKYNIVHPKNGNRKFLNFIKQSVEEGIHKAPVKAGTDTTTPKKSASGQTPGTSPLTSANNKQPKTIAAPKTAAAPITPAEFKPPVKEEDPELAYLKDNIGRILAYHLDDVFTKVLRYYEEDAVKSTDGVPAEIKKEAAVGEDAANAAEEATPTAEVKVTEVNATEANAIEANATEDAKAPVEVKPIADGNKDVLDEKYGALVEVLLKRKLPRMLPRYKNVLLSVLCADRRFNCLKIKLPAEIIPERKPMYFVKISGKPSLPKRHAMQTFLNQFAPQSIKKHRNIYNLLFVGVTDPNNYEALLQKNMCTVGDCLLIIKESNDKYRNLPNPEQYAENIPQPEPGNFTEDVQVPDEGAPPASTTNGEVVSKNGEEEVAKENDSAQETPAVAPEDENAVNEDAVNEDAVNEDAMDEQNVSIGAVIGELDDEIDDILDAEDQPERQAEPETKAPDTPASAGIQTRRSSRLPQK